VVRKDAWRRSRPTCASNCCSRGRNSKKDPDDLRKQNEDAVDQMKKRGLHVNKPLDLPGWQKAAEHANAVVRGKVVPRGDYDEVKKYRDEFRAQNKR